MAPEVAYPNSLPDEVVEETRPAAPEATRPHPYHRVMVTLRVLGLAGGAGLMALLAADGLVPWRIWTQLSILGFSMAGVSAIVAPRLDPSPEGASRTILVDVPFFALCIEQAGASGPFLTLTTVVTAVNFATNFGLLAGFASVGALWLTAALFHAVLGTPLQVGVTSVVAEVYMSAILALYVSSIGAEARKAGVRARRAREELRTLASVLEDRVAERTATLSSTNAAIERFVPREFLQALGHADVTTARLGDASSRNVTVLFADIRDFTSMSESLSPAETFAFLNGCLSRIGPHVRAQSGFVDKYIGDAIMALFPRDTSDAVRAAVAMQVEVLATNRRNPNRPPLAVGVGIHVGSVMMGTIGEAERFEATVISDVVNLTARLESLTKQLGCNILVSEDVHQDLDPDLQQYSRHLGSFVVKGRTHAVELYEIFAADPEPLRNEKLQNRPRFEAMLRAFGEDRFDQALGIASDLRDISLEDGPANWWFMRLMQETESDEAAPSSRGIIRLTEK